MAQFKLPFIGLLEVTAAWPISESLSELKKRVHVQLSMP
jgi:hypothetical protein